jgi:hypothetical protein
MQQISHLKLMSMGCLQACGFFMEQMPYNVTIDVNKFLGAFSMEEEGKRICPPSWVQGENNSVAIGPLVSTTLSETSTLSPVFNMVDYRKYRQKEALQWIDLQEKRSSIIARLQPTSPEEFQKLRDAVMSDNGPLCRKGKKQSGMNRYSY